MSPLKCPLCGQHLEQIGPSYACPLKHTFDISKYAYTNLLVGEHGGQHGDNLEMIRARQDFLNAGYYAPLKEVLLTQIQSLIPTPKTYLDSGCGEGYYSSSIAEYIGAGSYGTDISKEALRCAHARNAIKTGLLHPFVASSYALPFMNETFDLVTNIFAPFAKEEFLRVLKPNGHLFWVIPNEEHLMELKSILYSTPYKNEVQPYEQEGFHFEGAIPVVSKQTIVSHEHIEALFSMTPYFYRTPKEGRERLQSYTELTVTTSFLILHYAKK